MRSLARLLIASCAVAVAASWRKGQLRGWSGAYHLLMVLAPWAAWEAMNDRPGTAGR